MRLIEIINEQLKILNPVLDKTNNYEINNPKKFIFCQILERVKFSIISLKLLIENDIIKHDHAIGLISRNLLTDFITFGYLIGLSVNKEQFEKNLYVLLNCDLKRVDSEIEYYKNYGIPDEKRNEYFARYVNEIPYKTIRDYVNKHKLDKEQFPKTTTIIKKFLKAKRNDVLSKGINSFNKWFVYSKYEHLGWYSYELTRRINRDDAIKYLLNVLFDTTIMAAGCLEELEEKNAYDHCFKLVVKIKEDNNPNAI